MIKPHETREVFQGFDEWKAFVAKNSWAYDAQFIEALVAHARADGVYSRYLNSKMIPIVEGRNYRETITVAGLNSRARAVLDEFNDEVGGDRSKRILLLEAVTPFALVVRGRFPYALTTEYLPTVQDRERFFPITHVDLLATGFNEGVFDFVISNDVLEHVPDLPQAFREIRRILAPRGVTLATFPFAYSRHDTDVRAVIEGDAIVHLSPPEYHGNPIDPSGSLVFQVPGWDVTDMCLNAGFSQAEMLFVSSQPRGITGAECAGIFVLRAVA